jgi:hypothetical protein
VDERFVQVDERLGEVDGRLVKVDERLVQSSGGSMTWMRGSSRSLDAR